MLCASIALPSYSLHPLCGLNVIFDYSLARTISGTQSKLRFRMTLLRRHTPPLNRFG
jgi:hypothetical protein